MSKKTINLTFQQGDIVIRPYPVSAGWLAKSRAERRTTYTKGKSLVVAKGEATGHKHVLEVEETEAELIRIGETMILNLEKAGVLTHPEHGPVEIPAGTYEVGKVLEYNVAEGTEQQVHD